MSAIKKKNGGGGGGGHGGGWVITFADLMALLMALFVMIVSFSNEDEQKLHEAAGSIRDAFGFQPIARPAGLIERGGHPMRSNPRDVSPAATPDGTEFASRLNDQAERQGPEVDTNDFAKEAREEPRGYLTAAASLRQALQDLPDYADLSRQIVFKADADGLHISIIDQDGRAMFDPSSSEPVGRMRVLLGRIAPVLDQFPGRLRIIGHVSAPPNGSGHDVDSWRLSADKTYEVTGRADLDPLYAEDPFLSANRRVELVLVPTPPPLSRDFRL